MVSKFEQMMQPGWCPTFTGHGRTERCSKCGRWIEEHTHETVLEVVRWDGDAVLLREKRRLVTVERHYIENPRPRVYEAPRKFRIALDGLVHDTALIEPSC